MPCGRFKSVTQGIFEVTRFTSYLNEIYGGIKVSCGKVHDYLGMDLDYSDKGILKVLMVSCLNNVLR